MSDETEASELTKVAIDYATRANAVIADMLRQDGFVTDKQTSYIMAMTISHMMQLHLLRVRDSISPELAHTHRVTFAGLINATKEWL
jgi:hypothetical protein